MTECIACHRNLEEHSTDQLMECAATFPAETVGDYIDTWPPIVKFGMRMVMHLPLGRRRDPRFAYWTLDKDGKTPVPLYMPEDLVPWAVREMELAKVRGRLVALYACGKYVLSTVTLMCDHSLGTGPYLLWETALYQREGEECGLGELVEIVRRYPSWDDAVAGHRELALELRRRHGSAT